MAREINKVKGLLIAGEDPIPRVDKLKNELSLTITTEIQCRNVDLDVTAFIGGTPKLTLLSILDTRT